MVRLVCHTMDFIKMGAVFKFASAMEGIVCALLKELAVVLVLFFSDWYAVTGKSRTNSATFEQEQVGGLVHLIVQISRVTLANEQNWIPIELDVECILWSI